VHGTGIRLPNYISSFKAASARASDNGITAKFVECAWGDPFGIEFDGLSLPEPSDDRFRREEEDFARWSWLLDDPLLELERLTIRPGADAVLMMERPGVEPERLRLWERIRTYEPTPAMAALLKRGGLQEIWRPAWEMVAGADVTPQAFERSAHELPAASEALARAVVAALHLTATEKGRPGPSRQLRDSIADRLQCDWDQKVLAPNNFLVRMFKRAATRTLRRHRDAVSTAVLMPIGDILLYQSRGSEIRKFIRDAIEAAAPPVTIVAHSLGGIACFDLLALPDPPKVSGLVTVGSQASLLYEIGALASINSPKPFVSPRTLPDGFPPWLNIYDQNDFLSYVASGLFEGVDDLEVESGQPFLDSHSAYFGNDEVWKAIGKLMKP
jgi:hypothetical protein